MARHAGNLRLWQAVGAGRLCRVAAREAKIAALGLRVRNGCTYHGLAVNVAMDLSPFADIDPCGYPGLAVTQLADLGVARTVERGRRRARADSRSTRSPQRTLTHDRAHASAPTPPASSTRATRRPRASPSRSSPAERLQKPDWIRVRAPSSPRFAEIKKILREHNLHTVCEEASCPNIGECFSKGTATFMIMGDICTRRCPFCDVGHGRPLPLDADEPRNLATTIAALRLAYVVDHERRSRRSARWRRAAFRRLHPRGARAVARERRSKCSSPISAAGSSARSRSSRAAPPDVMNHNLETVPRLYRQARPGSDYAHSLALLARFQGARFPAIPTKSGLMVGLGETDDEILAVMRDMRAHDIDMLTIGQYLQPTAGHLPVLRYVHPDRVRGVRARGVRDGLPARGRRRDGALVVSRRSAGGRGPRMPG